MLLLLTRSWSFSRSDCSLFFLKHRTQPPEVCYEKSVLKNFARLIRKQEIETLAQAFSCELCKIFKNSFFTEPFRHLRWLLVNFLIARFRSCKCSVFRCRKTCRYLLHEHRERKKLNWKEIYLKIKGQVKSHLRYQTW